MQRLNPLSVVVKSFAQVFSVDLISISARDHVTSAKTQFFHKIPIGLFIDNFGRNSDLILLFKDYLQDPFYKKIWHNYGYDRHIFYNHGIDVKGFGGDTMHMARLADAS